MKIYCRILGILSFLITVSFLGFIIYLLVSIDDGPEKRFYQLILLIPTYIIMHFVIIHNFGFNLKFEYSAKQSRSILITALLFFVILLLLIGWQISEIVTLQKQEEISRKESEELYAHLSKLRTFDKKMTAYGFEGELQTKFSAENVLLYKLRISSKKPFNPDLVSFTIEFHDKDGFLIKSINIKDYTTIIDGDKIVGIVSNSKTDPWEFGAEEVESIANWRLLIGTK